jgi:hypothetical protein
MSAFVGGAGSANRFWNAFEEPTTTPLTTTADTSTMLSIFMNPHSTPGLGERNAANNLLPLKEPILRVRVSKANAVFNGHSREFCCTAGRA